MAFTPIKALLFLAGGATAAAATAYVSGVFDPYLGAAPVAALSVPAAPGVDAKAGRLPEPAEKAPGGSEMAAVTPPSTTMAPEAPAMLPAPPAADTPAAPKVLPPSFDLVRVESNGSIVIAGKAAPNSKVEIVIGARVIGGSVTGPDGDFAIVVDEPLKPGGYQLVLRSTTPDNVVATSPETAVVSIPDTESGQVLALVEQPGAPSKLITVPQPEPLAAKPQPKTEDSAVTPPAKAPAPAAPAPSDTAAAVAPPVAAPSDAKPAEPAAKPAAPAPQVEAAVQPEPAPVQIVPAAPSGDPKVTVEAVEIEGRKIFVAGAADAGRTVRAYANDILLGETQASAGGRFLIETERDLPVGDYIIRIDALGPDGVKVVARAAVPFEREPGETVAAVAAPAAEPKPAAPEASAQAPAAATTTPEPEQPAVQAPKTADAEAAQTAPKAAQPAESGAVVTESAPKPGPATVAPAAPVKPGDETQAAAAPEPAAPQTAVSDAIAPETIAPKLQSVEGAVIIRRGDSLWRISKRVYGRGVRFSTIYLANQTQISDPDRIWPGQVFTVPVKTSQGEQADMKAVGDQATTTKTQ